MLCATIRAFANVKSSAITPRQPSVPNLIEVMFTAKSIRERDCSPNSRIGLLEEVLPTLLCEPFHDFADVLRAVARADQQRIRSIHDDQVVHANQRRDFSRARDEIAARVQGVTRRDEHISVPGIFSPAAAQPGPPGSRCRSSRFPRESQRRAARLLPAWLVRGRR